MANTKRAIVFGAAGGMGRMFLDRLESAGFETLGADLNGGEGIVATDLTALDQEMRQALKAADLVILSVPDAIACKTAASVARAMSPQAMLVDCTSVKAPYVEAVGQAGRCGLVSINPLFGPGLDWTGNSIVITVLRTPDYPEDLTGFLERSGLNIIPLDAERHDRLAAEAQAQLHATILGFIASVSADGALFNTPPNRVMRMLAARILSGEAHVYWKIQASNPFAGEARRKLIASLQAFDEVCEAGDAKAFADMLAGARGNLGAPLPDLSAQCVKVFGSLD
ncbi:MAG: prephenate dehydrogenase/arogenate dehydrogenase family protein [Henriciella sp.]|uniref:prephenate dehydrogenase/arogenate dehydrogenase family protein n=1 Tax=Henriciella sp. TaxID=1968823 RepID=UPI0032EACA6B